MGQIDGEDLEGCGVVFSPSPALCFSLESCLILRLVLIPNFSQGVSSPLFDFGVDKMGHSGFRWINFNRRDLSLFCRPDGFADVGEVTARSNAQDKIEGSLRFPVEHFYLLFRK